MATKYDNDALNIQLKLTTEINELLKTRGINVSELNVKLRTYTKDNKKVLKNTKEVWVSGDIQFKIDGRLNKEKQKFDLVDGDDSFYIGDDDLD